jgi:integrase/recombinase XerD
MKAENRKIIIQWLEWKEHNEGRQPGTINKYLGYLDGLSGWLLADRQVELLQASEDDLKEFCGKVAHKNGMAPRSRRPLIAAIKGFFAWALKNGLVLSNPAEDVPYPRSGRRPPKGMDLAAAESILLQLDLDTFLGVRDMAILLTFMGCGMRLSGLCRLNQSDLIWSQDGKKKRLYIRVIEKGDHLRYVPAPDDVYTALRAYLGHAELQEIDRMLPDGDQVLFVSTMDRRLQPHEYYGEARRLSPRSIEDMIERLGAMAGIPRDQCHPHALRHLYGTEMTESDVNVLKLQALMGHSDANTTKSYAHVALRSLAKAVDEGNPLSKIKTPVSELAKIVTAQ